MIDFDKEIFDEELEPVIVLIGEKENVLSREIKEKYEEHCMIEIYTQDLDTDKFKLITKDTNKIIKLLRMITYTNSSRDDVMPEHYNGLAHMREMLRGDIKKGNIEIYQWEGKLEEIKQTINRIPESFVDQNCMIQIVGNDKLDAYICASIWSRISGKKLFFEDVRILCFAYL